jgi:Co/Zn/Cd efflux system component
LNSNLIADKSKQTLAFKLFESICTYEYKRLPLLGSFVNGIFLAALLMSAAIEGLQTCFHVKHSENHDSKTILTENVATYPIILAGFAFVGLVMQYCSNKAHEMREEELCSESLLDLSSSEKKIDHHHDETTTNLMGGKPATAGGENQIVISMKELSASELLEKHHKHDSSSSRRRSYDLNRNRTSSPTSDSSRANQSLQELPFSIKTGEIAHNDEATRVSLQSLKITMVNNVDSSHGTFHTVCLDGPSSTSTTGHEQDRRTKAAATCKLAADASEARRRRRATGSPQDCDRWFLVRCLASPSAMLICAIIFYFVRIELMTEISDAALAVSVVILLFAASYPPMKKAGRILLQTVPDGVNLEQLKRELESSSEIIEVRQLHVWSLTPRSNRVATCQLVLDKNRVTTEKQVQQIVQEARFKFLEQRIKCTTIEPVLLAATNDQKQT